MNLKTLALIVATVVVASSAMAQGGGGGRRGGGQRGNQNSLTALVNRADVQKELAITDDEKTKITDLQASTRTKMQDARTANQGDRAAGQAASMKIQEEADTSLEGILTADQTKRLHELLIQRMGTSAVFNPKIQTALGITDDQKSKLKDLQEKENTANAELRTKQQNQEIDAAAARDARTKNTAVMTEEVNKILTDDQKSKLKDMGGKPFTFENVARGGGRAGGGR